MKVERDDRTLVDAARRGDESAFATLYAAHHGPIYRYAVHMCGAGAADDVVQETFLALLRARRFDPARGDVRAYLYGIARHHILKALAISRLETPLDDDVGTAASLPQSGCGPQTTVLDELTRTERIEAVRAAIQSLPLVYREIVVLCELQELDYAAAAAIIDCPIGTVRSRLHRARALLMAKLAAMGDVGADPCVGPGRTRGSAPTPG